MRILAFLIFFYSFLFQVQTCYSQIVTDKSLGGKYLQTAIDYSNQLNLDSAIIFSQKAKELLKKDEKWGEYFYATILLNRLKIALFHKDDIVDSIVIDFNRNIDEVISHSHQIYGMNNLYEANAYYAKAFLYTKIWKYDEARRYAENGLEIFINQKEHPLFPKTSIECLFNVQILNTYIYTRKFDKAMDFGERTVLLLKEKYGESNVDILMIYNALAAMYLEIKNFDKSLEYYLLVNTTLAKANMTVGYSLYENTGRLYKELANFPKAAEYFEKALVVKRKVFGEIHIQILKSYNRLGGVYKALGKYNESIDYFNRGMDMLVTLRGENSKGTGTFYHNRGQALHFKGDYKKALQNHRMALMVRYKYFGDNQPYTTNSYNAVGMALLELGELDSAEWYLSKGLNIRLILDKKRPDMKMHLADSYNNMGKVNAKKGNFVKAIEYHKNAIETYEKLYGKKHSDVADSYQNLANVYAKQEKYKLALKNYHKAIIANTVDFDNDSIEALPQSGDHISPIFLLSSLISKAKVFEKVYHADNKENSNNLLLAFKTYQLCDALLTESRKTHNNEADKINWMQKSRDVYEGGINVGYQLFELTNDKKYLEEIFIFSEKSKASILSDRSLELNAQASSKIPKDLLNRERDLSSAIASFKIRLQREKLGAKDKSKMKTFADSLFQLKRREEKLIDLFESQCPDYYDLKYKYSVVNVSKVQNSLKRNMAFLEYFITDQDIYLFVIDKDVFEVRKINYSKKQFSQKVFSLVKTVKKEDSFDEYKQYAFQIYQQVFSPVSDLISAKRLIIIPDGILWYINFDILLKNDLKQDNYSQLPFLINKHIISYAYSAELLMQSKESKSQTAKKKCLAFSYSGTDSIEEGSFIAMRALRDDPKVDLPGTRKEITDISKIMDGDYYYGTFASEKNFKETAKDYAILHLALHGEVNEKDPLQSGLLFTQNENDTTEDNKLYAYELYNMELNAELAVLSACNTATGQLENGEGLMSLGRAFMYAGCKSLLMSQWEISDWSTSGIMKDFYGYLDQGMNKDEALHQAKLDYINKANNLTSNPYFWAPLVLLGDNERYKKNESYLSYYLIAGFILISVIFLKSKKYIFNK